jgi:hypothetical protein
MYVTSVTIFVDFRLVSPEHLQWQHVEMAIFSPILWRNIFKIGPRSLLRERDSRRHSAATVIQKNWRRFAQRSNFLSLKKAAVAVQGSILQSSISAVIFFDKFSALNFGQISSQNIHFLWVL